MESYYRMDNWTGRFAAVFLGAVLLLTCPLMADEAETLSPVKIDPAKIAGVDLPEEEQWMSPEDVLAGVHRPRGEILYYGDQLIIEVYEDDPGVYRFPDPFTYDEFVEIQSGKLILTGSDGIAHEYLAGDTLVVPKGWTGTWEMIGNYRELIVIDREAYEAEYGTADDSR